MQACWKPTTSGSRIFKIFLLNVPHNGQLFTQIASIIKLVKYTVNNGQTGPSWLNVQNKHLLN